MNEEVIHRAEQEHCAAEPDRNAVQLALHQFLVLAHFDADITEHAAPDR